RERAPGAADRVKATALAALEHRRLAQRLADDLLGFLQGPLGQIQQREAAERQGYSAAQGLPMHIDQFERAAAKIADDAIRAIEARDHAERGISRLLLAGQNLDALAADAFGRGDELRPIVGVTAGR